MGNPEKRRQKFKVCHLQILFCTFHHQVVQRQKLFDLRSLSPVQRSAATPDPLSTVLRYSRRSLPCNTQRKLVLQVFSHANLLMENKVFVRESQLSGLYPV